MFIEDEADAVFNEIRNQRQDNDDKGESSTSNETKAVSPAPAAAPLMTLKVATLSRAEEQTDKTATECGGDEIGEADIELEEPVSPPACHPSEGPPLLFSQSIEVRKDSQHNQPVLTSLSVSGLGSRHREGEKTG